MRAIQFSSVWLLLAAGMGAQGFHDDFLQQLDEIQTKTVALAHAIHAERYTWRPGPGVRSVSEVLLHVAGSNFVNAMFLGVPVPADVPLDRGGGEERGGEFRAGSEDAGPGSAVANPSVPVLHS